MKQVLFIGGPMGIGKTTISKSLAKKLEHSVFLDGDWCWDTHPFIVNDENKEMVIKNITFLLNSFLENTTIQTIVFCWVMHEQTIIDSLVTSLNEPFEFHSFSLISDEQTLTNHFMKDVQQGNRAAVHLENSLIRLPLYQELDTTCIDISTLSIEEATNSLLKHISN
ncbi:AAA family ATPase [Enterococcus larvae]|uniref:AAA family ATPase n=1 Tax=Enterococcus larvae TaxID=2794352 RepID=UPI003F353D3F